MHVPDHMLAWTIREHRFGPPIQALALEEVAVPKPGPGEVLIRVMAAGVNPNAVFAALGEPLNIPAGLPEPADGERFCIPGSDASGVVVARGAGVNRLAIGDCVVVHGGSWDADCEVVRAGQDPMLSPTAQAWGYQTQWGALAQYCLVQAHQCLPKPAHLSWAEAGCFMVAGATAHRMLTRWQPHVVGPGRVVLIWGAGSGIGCQAVQLVRAYGGIPVGVVSSAERAALALRLGAAGCIDRRRFDHWGPLPDWRDKAKAQAWLNSAREFRQAVRQYSPDQSDPELVLEHPGEATLPTSMFVCKRGGMVVLCGGSSGYQATFDLRIAWTWQKRFQGSHGMDDRDAEAIHALVVERRIDPCLSTALPFDAAAQAQQLLYNNAQPPGNMAVLVAATSDSDGRGIGVEARR
jgi:crotonyl-CoA carboxylase/reductase